MTPSPSFRVTLAAIGCIALALSSLTCATKPTDDSDTSADSVNSDTGHATDGSDTSTASAESGIASEDGSGLTITGDSTSVTEGTEDTGPSTDTSESASETTGSASETTGGMIIDCTDDPNLCPQGYGCACGGPGPMASCTCGLACQEENDCIHEMQPVCCTNTSDGAGVCTDACTCYCR